MKVLNLITKYKQRIFSLIIVMFGLFPLLSEKIKGLPVIIFLVFILLLLIATKDKQIRLKYLLENSSLFLISLFSIFYSFSFVIPKNKLETSLSLLIIPLAFSSFKPNFSGFNKKNKKIFYNVFVFSSTFLGVIMLFHYYNLGFFFEETLKVNSFREATISITFLKDHPIYVSIFYGLSTLFLLGNLFNKECNLKKRGVNLFSLVILVTNLILLSSKGVLIATVVSAICYSFFTLKGKNKFYIISVIMVFFIGTIIFSPTVARRFKEFRIKTTYTEFHPTNSSSLRIAIYKCAIKKIKEKPILGYGWGESKENLLLCYKQTNEYLYKGNYNSHNQYLGYMLNGGVFGIAILILFLLKNFRYSLMNKDYIFASTITFFSITMLFENILERQSGIILFIFMVCFFNSFNKKY